jgi:hypothetical protein
LEEPNRGIGVRRYEQGAAHKERRNQDADSNGVEYPATRGGICGKVPGKHKASTRQSKKEDDRAHNIVEITMQGLNARSVWWITQNRISHEEASSDERESKDAEEDGSPGGTFARVKCTPEANSKAEHKDSRDNEIRDLHPSQFTLTQRADKVMPPTIVGTSSPFNEKYNNEEQGTDYSTDEQQPGCE